MGGETIGQRFFQIRLALGDGVRRPMSMRKFVALVKDRTGRRLHASELSEIESGKREEIAVNDAIAVADVDPKRRGLVWLIRGGAAAKGEVLESARQLTPAEIDAALREAEAKGQQPDEPPSDRRRGA